jgi:molybdopterin-binding protein
MKPRQLIVDEAIRISARNRLWGTVQRMVDGPVMASGVRACAAFKVSSVILAVID